MSNDSAVIERVQAAAGERYKVLLYYSRLCSIAGAVVLIASIVAAVTSFITAITSRKFALIAESVMLLVQGVSLFVGLLVIGNIITAVVDIAVNSFIQVELAKHREE